MKFVHIADCHIGGWRDSKLNVISEQALTYVIDFCSSQKIDFLLIAGDLFNTAYPGIDKMKLVTEQLKKLKDQDIRVYMIAGSHDSSPTGKTMLDVLEKAGLAVNVTKGEIVDDKLKLHFTTDELTGAKITGILGKKGQLDKNYYERLIHENLEQESGFKIFLFHTTITELKPKEMDKVESAELSFLPKGFDYYAGGHVHIVKNETFPNYKNVIYPGPLFPNSFSELEKLKQGGFYFFDTENNTPIHHPICIKEIITITKDCNHSEPQRIEQEIREELQKRDVKDKIVVLRLHGMLKTGRRSDIHFREIQRELNERECYVFLRNTAKLETKQFEEIKMNIDESKDIEISLIKEHLGQIQLPETDIEQEKELTKTLITTLKQTKKEGETKTNFEKRIKEEMENILKTKFSE